MTGCSRSIRSPPFDYEANDGGRSGYGRPPDSATTPTRCGTVTDRSDGTRYRLPSKVNVKVTNVERDEAR